MEKLRSHQLFCMTMMVQIGSTNLWAFGTDAKRDAWIVTLLSMIGGFGLTWIFLRLHARYPRDNIAGISVSVLGKGLGFPLALVYVMLFIFNATRNTSEFADLINMTFLTRTPRALLIAILLFTVIAVLFLKIESIARLSEVVMPLTLIIVVSVYILIIASGRVDLKELAPAFEQGITPVLTATYPVGINFPFGLTFIFLQIWPYFDAKNKIGKITYLSLLISGVLLTATQVIDISVLGVELTKTSTLPLLEVVKLINIADIITNLDVIGVVLIFIGGFFLATAYIFCAAGILSTLFHIRNYTWFLIPIGVFIFWYSGVYEPNYPAHIKYLVPQYWQQFVPLFDIIPILLLIISKLKESVIKREVKPFERQPQ